MCCVKFAGIYHPNDFIEAGKQITEEFIYGLLRTGKFSVNCWDGDFSYDGKDYADAYFLHPRHFGQNPYDRNYGGTCSNWTLKSGCSLGFKDRPYQCRALVARINADRECKSLPKDKASKEDLIFAWLPYSHILRRGGVRLEDEGLNFHSEGDYADVYEKSGSYQILMGRRIGEK
jgi:hypothetical protein